MSVPELNSKIHILFMSCLIELSNLKATVNICRQLSATCMTLHQSYGSQDMKSGTLDFSVSKLKEFVDVA